MPTVFTDGAYRYYFFSREETRKHIHVSSADGEAKVWLEPEIIIAKSVNIPAGELNKILKVVKERKEEINDFWNRHFNSN
ncbi:MAG: DUF4160 domain-containing protein [Treponema sp.]|nr:DUF4160 domain-containing protein [Candidatus Treponema caballi]